MASNQKLKPFLHVVDKTGKQYISRLGTRYIPIVSSEPEPFDGEQYGMLSCYTIDSSRLSAERTICLAQWIAEETGGKLPQMIEDIGAGKCLLPVGERFEVVWLDQEAQFWG